MYPKLAFGPPTQLQAAPESAGRRLGTELGLGQIRVRRVLNGLVRGTQGEREVKVEKTVRLGRGGPLKLSPPAIDLWCFPFREVGVRWRQGRCVALELSCREQKAVNTVLPSQEDGCSFLLCQNILKLSWSPRARTSDHLSSICTCGKLMLKQRGAVTPKVIQQIWFPPQAHWL